MNAVDTNIVVYSVVADEPERTRAAVGLLNRLSAADTVLLWQVACELGAVLTRLTPTIRANADPYAVLRSLRKRFPLVMPSSAALDYGLRMRQEYQLSYWDALLLGACRDAGVTRLYTEDRQSRSVIEGIEIVSPF